jgi:dATP pyrophosphohydrolase
MYKIPRSVLVDPHERARGAALERAPWPGYWQSVTGSVDGGRAARRDGGARVREETGIDATRHALVDWGIDNRYEIYRKWRSRYAPGVTHNVERVFGLTLPAAGEPVLAPAEHSRYLWLPWREAADKCFSWSNRDAILMLPERVTAPR